LSKDKNFFFTQTNIPSLNFHLGRVKRQFPKKKARNLLNLRNQTLGAESIWPIWKDKEN